MTTIKIVHKSETNGKAVFEYGASAMGIDIAKATYQTRLNIAENGDIVSIYIDGKLTETVKVVR